VAFTPPHTRVPATPFPLVLRAGRVLLVLALLTAAPALAQNSSTTITNVAHGSAVFTPGGLMSTTSNESVVQVGRSQGQNGTTLSADVAVTGTCTAPDGRLRVSGSVSVANGGEVATQGLTIVVRMQYKLPRILYTDLEGAAQTLTIPREIVAGGTASYPFSITFSPIVKASYRVAALVTIVNHSGQLGIAFGPEPKTDVSTSRLRACPTTTQGVASVLDSGGDQLPAVAPASPLEVMTQAGVLEASLGDVIPYAVTVRNTGAADLHGVVIHDRLSAGVSFTSEHVGAGDVVSVQGREVRITLGTPLAPGQERTVGYTVTLLEAGATGSLENAALATAEGGGIRSETASASVRVRPGFALEARAIIGRVWVDSNGNGRQDPGEPGAAGVEVWSADGEVVRTDRDGRYSFRNVRAGTHALRVNPSGLQGRYRLARAEDAVMTVRLDGWTTPRVDFRLLPAPQGSAGAVAVESTAGASVSGPVVIAPLRTTEQREEEARRAFVEGPRVQVLTPVDGAVVLSNRLYVGVQGEAGAPVQVFAGAALVREGVLRPDGREDFVAIELAEGTHTVRIRMQNSWGQAVWDSVAVHRSGAPAAFRAVGQVPALRAEDAAEQRARVLVLDRWGVPVPGGVATVDAVGATVGGTDTDRSSGGHQLTAGPDGVLDILLTPGQRVGPGELRLQAGKAVGRVPLRVLPSVGPLMVVGSAQVGVGAAPEAFGAVTVRGAVTAETAVTVSYDTRRRTARDDFFGRGYDPLAEGRYPIYGDDSERRVLASGTQTLSARVENGFNWVAFGDVETGDFGGRGRLATYRRAVSGVAARIETGPVTWRTYGSRTDQVLAQVQLRGNGTSGPYRFGGNVRPGTDRVLIEVRSAQNAAAVIARQELIRFVDYQIDYVTGEVLLNRPLPATDAAGNPLFVVALHERRTGGAAQWMAGLRVDLDAGRVLGVRGADSLRVFALATHEAGDLLQGTLGRDVFGGGVNAQVKGIGSEVEVLQSADDASPAYAARALLSYTLPAERGRFEAEWTRIGAGFDPTVDPRLSAGLEDLRLGARVRVAEGSHVRLSHSRQRFDSYGAERRSTQLQVEHRVLGRTATYDLGASTDAMTTPGTLTSNTYLTGKGRLAATDRASVWVEGGHALGTSGPLGMARRDQVGVGASYRLFKATHVEAVHRWVGVGTEEGYSLLSGQVRTESPVGTLWGGLDRAMSEAPASSLVAGWKPRVRVTRGWSVDGMVERRVGLEQAGLLDPGRALPFAQPESDRWAAGLGTQWVLPDSLGRLSARGEMHDGQLTEGYRLELQGDLQLGRSLALLTRHDWRDDNRASDLGGESRRSERSLAALAFRPAHSSTLNVLGKAEWRNDTYTGVGTRFGGTPQGARLIGMFDAIWSVGSGSEVSGRYAVRRTLSGTLDPAVTLAVPGSVGHYVGTRVSQQAYGPVGVRVDARVLASTGGTRWNAAPSLVLNLVGQIEVEGGYRFGTLEDVDFALGGNGAYVSLGIRFSENTLGRMADVWRHRIASGH
jgi:uncharacterized repeat protein (TIGR01451 family)